MPFDSGAESDKASVAEQKSGGFLNAERFFSMLRREMENGGLFRNWEKKLIGLEWALKLKLRLKLNGNLAKLVLVGTEEKRALQLGGGVKGGSLTAEEMNRTPSVSAIFAGEMLDPSLPLTTQAGFYRFYSHTLSSPFHTPHYLP